MSNKNMILITTDQQQAQAIGCLDKSYDTPNLDRLVQAGVRFSHHICTSAQCTPARATWMTGRYPHEVGVNVIGHQLNPDDENIAECFRQNGYECVYFGKWHLGGKPGDYGFQVTDYRCEGADLWGAHDEPAYYSHQDAVTTAQAVNYISDYDGERPFFMHVSWHMPHPNHPDSAAKGPFEDVSAYDDRFALDRMPIPASFYDDDLLSKPPHQRNRAQSAESALTEEMVRQDARKYRKLIALMDRNLGKILSQLEQKQLLDETMIVFTSDHGDMQGAHRLRLKGVVPYKEIYHVPLIIHVPWIESKRKVIDDLTSSAALAATLLEAANIKPPQVFHPSLMHLFGQAEKDPAAHVFIEHYKAYWGQYPFRGIQTETVKYVYYYDDDWEEMYDLERDPQEIHNVCDEPRYAEIKQELRMRVDRWWEQTGALSRQPLIDPASKWNVPSR